MLERIDGRQWCGTRIFALPRTEVAVGLYLSRRSWVGEAGYERCGVSQTNRVHLQLVNEKNVGQLLRISGNELQFRVIRKQLVDENWDVASTRTLLRVSLFAGWNMDGQSLQVNFAQVPGFTHQRRPFSFCREFLNRDQRRYVSATVVPQYQSPAVDRELRKQRYSQVSEFDIAVETVAKHGHGAAAYDGIDVTNNQDQSYRDQQQQDRDNG